LAACNCASIGDQFSDGLPAPGDDDFFPELHTIEQPAEFVFCFDGANLNQSIPPRSLG
jgi:hypothetical protein